MRKTAKLFPNGNSQAVRLPAAYRFDGDEVYIDRDPRTGDVILSAKPGDWRSFFDLAAQSEIPADFLSESRSEPPQVREEL